MICIIKCLLLKNDLQDCMFKQFSFVLLILKSLSIPVQYKTNNLYLLQRRQIRKKAIVGATDIK